MSVELARRPTLNFRQQPRPSSARARKVTYGGRWFALGTSLPPTKSQATRRLRLNLQLHAARLIHIRVRSRVRQLSRQAPAASN